MERKTEEFEKLIKRLDLNLEKNEVLRCQTKLLELYKTLLNFEKQKRSKLNQYSQNGEKISKDW